MTIDKIMLFVDGPTEQGAFENKFRMMYNGKSPRFAINPGNGLYYPINTFARLIAPNIIVALKSSFRCIMVVTDLEKCEKKFKISCNDLEVNIKQSIINEIIKTSSFKQEYLNEVIYVCASNIMFENWIVCDLENIKSSKLIKDGVAQDFYDVQNGSSLLNGMMTCPYKKTVHAKMLFKKVRDDVGRSYSPSYSNFMTSIEKILNPN